MKRSPLFAILLIAFVDLAAFGLIIPFQADYAERLGANGVTFGALIGIYALMQFVFNPILGRWSDRIGRRPVLLISVAGSFFSHTLLGVADLANSLPLLFLARALDGITGANIATAQAYIADVTDAKDRAKGMGMFGAAFGLGFVVGPALGAGLASIGGRVSGEIYGTSWPAFGAAGLSLIAFLFVWRWLPESRDATHGKSARTSAFALDHLRETLSRPRLRELVLIVFSATFAFVLLETTFVYLCRREFGIGGPGIGYIFAYIGIMMVIVQGGLTRRLVNKFGEPRLVATGPFLTAIGFILISAVPFAQDQSVAWLLLLGGCAPVSLGQGLLGPSLNSLISRQAHDERQGVTLGTSQGLASLARAIAPPLGGFLFDAQPSLPYWVGAGMLVIIGGFAIVIQPGQRLALAAEGASTSAPGPAGS